MIMLSATPHDGRAKSFASLMNMLDPTAIVDENNYTPDDIKGLCIRRFKNDVKDQVSGSFLERKIELERCHATPKEEYAFEIFGEMQLQMDTDKRKGSGQLFKTSLEKSLFSSPAACIKSIEQRLNKLRKKYNDKDIDDIRLLEEFLDSLNQIQPVDFSRYQNLLKLLKNSDYAWNPSAKDDRIVIFTERIETMKYLAENLRKDLKMTEKQVVEISGAMSDADQQKIVEDFGREESPVRILVASDVASEGLNLHYLSHRMIHFDIPWSLMVFQQRNGRIDRYGQTKRPDIRYMLIESDNKHIRGDMRIIEILISKEEQALKNIGDPALLLGKFSVEEEELAVAETIETGSDTDVFESLFNADAEFNPFEELMAQAASEDIKEQVRTKNDETLFTDINYLKNAFSYLNRNESHPIIPLETVSGIEIKVTDDLMRRLKALMPEEALPKDGSIRLCDDKEFCMKEMKRSMQNNMEDTAWPHIQYLWSLHPIMTWANDKSGLLFGRGEAPVIGINTGLEKDEMIFILTGSIPNKKSTPLVDEWFGFLYKDGRYSGKLEMEKIIQKTDLRNERIPNTNAIGEKELSDASALLNDVISHAEKHLNEHYKNYQERMNPLLDEELDKLSSLESRHKDYQLSLFSDERKKSEQERKVDELFERFYIWVQDTLTIQNNPYIRVVAVVMGV